MTGSDKIYKAIQSIFLVLDGKKTMTTDDGNLPCIKLLLKFFILTFKMFTEFLQEHYLNTNRFNS